MYSILDILRNGEDLAKAGKDRYQEKISKRIREKERSKIRKLITPTTILLILFILIFFIINTPTATEILNQREEIKALQNELEQIKIANQELRKKIGIMSSDEYIEEEARRKFGFIRENQTAYVVVNQSQNNEGDSKNNQDKFGIKYQFWENFAANYWSLKH